MNLIEKKIKQLPIGSEIELLLSDGMKVTGKLNDRDDECIEIVNDSEENIISLGEVKSVKLFISSAGSQKAPEQKEQVQSAPVPKISFMTEIKNIMASDAKLTGVFKELSKEEKKIINSGYTSFMSAVRNNDIDRALGIVNNLKRTIEDYSGKTPFGENTYKLLTYMYTRCYMYDPELYIKGKSYDL